MSAEWPVNDDSIRESQACVSLPYPSITSLVWREVYSLCLCLPGTIRGLLVSMVLISSEGDGISVAAVSSEMALTGRSHPDNKPSINSPPPFFFFPPSHPFPYVFLFFDFISFFPFSHFLLPLSFICLTTFSFLSNVFFGNKHPGIFFSYSGHS